MYRPVAIRVLPTASPLLTLLIAVLVASLYSHSTWAGQWNLLMSDNVSPYHHMQSGLTPKVQNSAGGVQYDFGGKHQSWFPFVTASGFIDSSEQASFYAGGGIANRILVAKDMDNFHVDLGMLGVVMSRAAYREGEPHLGALPMLSVGTDSLSLNITYVPQADSEMSELWLFHFKIAKKSFW